MRKRYVIQRLPDGSRWVIFDRHLGSQCMLPDGTPLEWASRTGAREWMDKCRVAWAEGLAPAPEGWEGASLVRA